MLPISELSALSLSWQQPSAWRREYLLRSDSGLHGRLVFTSAFRDIAEAQIGNQAWKFDRTGVFKRQVLVWRAGEAETFAVYYPNTWRSGGRLELGSTAYDFSSNFWQTRFEIWGADEQPLVTLHKSGVLRVSAEVEIDPAAHRLPELPLLVALGMYTTLLHYRDTAAAAATT